MQKQEGIPNETIPYEGQSRDIVVNKIRVVLKSLGLNEGSLEQLITDQELIGLIRRQVLGIDPERVIRDLAPQTLVELQEEKKRNTPKPIIPYAGRRKE